MNVVGSAESQDCSECMESLNYGWTLYNKNLLPLGLQSAKTTIS